MVTPGACSLCPPDATRVASARCIACDRAVCESHVRTLYGVCRECATDEGLERMNRAPERPHPRDALGIKWIEE